MARFTYPVQDDLRKFVSILRQGDHEISHHLPSTSEYWFEALADMIRYVGDTEEHAGVLNLHEVAARLMYKVVKRHKFDDGNKRSAVIGVFLFLLLNDANIASPDLLIREARRIARTRGRTNEQLVCRRVAEALERIILTKGKRAA